MLTRTSIRLNLLSPMAVRPSGRRLASSPLEAPSVSLMRIGVFTDSFTHREMYSDAGFPVVKSLGDCGHCLIIGNSPRRPGSDVRIVQTGWIRQDTKRSFSRSLHQIGSPFVDLRTFEVPVGMPPFSPIYGAGTARPILSISPFFGKGTPIHRDDPQIAAVFWRIARNQDGPLGWIRPGFPAVVHLADWSLDGRSVEGILASSVDRPGGFVVLDTRDLLSIMGHSSKNPDLDSSVLSGLIPVECLARIIEWFDAFVESSISRSSSFSSPVVRRSTDAQSVTTPDRKSVV